MTRLHPFLFALFLTVSAYGEVRPLGDPREAAAWAPVLLLVAGGLFAGLRFGLKNAGKAALVTTVLLAFLGLAGELSIPLQRTFPDLARPIAGGIPWSLPVLAVLPILLIPAMLRSKRDPGPLNRAFLAGVAALLATAFGGLWLDRRDAAWQANVAPLPVNLKKSARPPDIYFIVLDAFTSLASLREFYHYDPAEFRAFLRINGFQVADGARSEYRNTTYSLASRLNMRYPPKDYEDWTRRYNRNVMFRIIERSAAPALLEAAGYTTVNLALTPVGTTKARYPIAPFLCFRSVRQMIAERSILRFCPPLPGASPRRAKKTAGVRPRTKWRCRAFADLDAVAAEPSETPRFVFAHIMLAHQPFLFNRDGRVHAQVDIDKAANADYLEQLIYTTGLLTQTVARILQQSPEPPVIILQGDHGYRYLKGTAAAVDKESYSMLNAILLPGMKDEEWREDLPPVNTFRLVFNHLFDAGIPYLTNSVSPRTIPKDIPEE